MSNRWETVAVFTTAIAAHAARTKLESEGIECFVADENLVGANPLYSNAVGGVKVQVAPADVPRARRALGEDAPGKGEAPGGGESSPGAEARRRRHGAAPTESEAQRFNVTHDLACPKCGSDNVERPLFSGNVSKLAWLLGSLVIMIPLPWFRSRRWKCRACGHVWAAGRK
jgi:rubredoxin